MRLAVTAAVSAILLFAAAARAEDARAAVEAANKKLSEAVSKHDGAAVAALYADDAIVFPAGDPTAKGHAAVAKLWEGTAKFLQTLELKTDEVTTHGDVAVESGTYSLTAGEGGKIADEGKYVVVWKKAKGNWLLWRDIWNSNRPPAPPPASAGAK